MDQWSETIFLWLTEKLGMFALNKMMDWVMEVDGGLMVTSKCAALYQVV